MDNYRGLVCQIKVRPHPNAQRLVLASCYGATIITSINTPDNSIGVYFEAGSQLDQGFSLHTNLLRKHPITGEKLTGYMDPNCKVRSLKLRGIIADGLWLPLKDLEYFGDVSYLKPGDSFNELNGHAVCWKFIPPFMKRKERAEGKQGPIKKKLFPSFYEIGDMDKLIYNLQAIPKGAHVYIEEKRHGSSQRTGYHQRDYSDLPWYKQLWFALTGRMLEWHKVLGTRRVVFDPDRPVKGGYYDDNTFRERAHNKINGLPGETFYYELVGYEGPGKTIMPRLSPGTDDLGKEIQAIYGNQIIYSYGCPDGESRLEIYKITQLTPDGRVLTLPAYQARARAMSLGLDYVPLLDQFIYNGNPQDFIDQCLILAEGSATDSPSHPREGIVVLVEHPEMRKVFKLKSKYFTYLEGIGYDGDRYLDTEEMDEEKAE